MDFCAEGDSATGSIGGVLEGAVDIC